MTASLHDTDRGYMVAINEAKAHFPSDRPAAAQLKPALVALVDSVTDTESTYQPERQTAAVERQSGTILSTFKGSIAAMLTATKETHTADVQMMTPPPAIADAAQRNGPEIRRNLSDLVAPALHGALVNADAVTLTAARELDWALLPQALPETRAMADERLAILYHIERTGMNAGRPAAPDAEGRILAVGTDNAAVYADAEAAFTRHKARLDGMDADEGIAQGLVTLVSAALKIDRKTALSRILSAA